MPQTAKVRVLPSLASRVRSFSRLRIVVVGDLVADHYVYGQTDRISREAPVLIVRYQDAEVKLGGAANAAANARALGAEVSVVGVLGDDEMGAALRRAFAQAGIDVRCPPSGGLPTETKTRILAGGINTRRQQMLRLDRGHQGEFPGKLREKLKKQLLTSARGADAVLVSDYGAGVAGEEVREALRFLAGSGTPVVADSRFQLTAFTGMTVCKPNEPELEACAGMPLRSEADLTAAANLAQRALQCRALLVTRGRSGMALFAEGETKLIPPHGSAEAVDVTGAGDTVSAALTLGLAAGAPVLDAARIANVAGALVVQKAGTATISQPELLRALAEVAG